MRIIVISDTHIPATAKELPPNIITELKNSSLCFHAGDFTSPEVAKEISKHTKLHGVRGNMDSQEVRSSFPETQIIKIGDFSIGLTHGSGAPFNIIKTVEEAFTCPVDIYIFGHTHLAYDKNHGDKIFFNPGSCTDKIFTDKNTYGILEIDGKNIKRTIVELKNG